MEALINLRKLCTLHSSNIRTAVLCKNHFRLASTANSEDQNIIATADEDYETLQLQKEIEIERKRNKSRLSPGHRNKLHGRVPYSEPVAESHLTFKYNRMLFGKYGKSSNVNPGTLWPTKSELQEMIEYEKIAHPFTFSELVEKQKKIVEEREIMIMAKQQKIIDNLKNLEGWKREITARAEKKLAELAKAKARKDALIEEVKRHFGYNVDPKDEKFKEMLVMKEREQKKKLKAEKSKAKQERFIAEALKKEEIYIL
nr:growth arrest and DNA damage-inducible proteins-interacting protein 1 isoform X2 [Halyomorpha halys]